MDMLKIVLLNILIKIFYLNVFNKISYFILNNYYLFIKRIKNILINKKLHYFLL